MCLADDLPLNDFDGGGHLTAYSLSNPERDAVFRERRNIWKILVPVGVLLLVLGIYGCTRALQTAAHEAYALAETFHGQMRAGDWKSIYANADEAYRQAITAENSAALFSGVVRKLGVPVSCKQGGTTLNANTSGNIIMSNCLTTFAGGEQAEEAFTWHKDGEHYRLQSYNVSSQAFVTK